MSNLEILKKELIAQKNAIEQKGGFVSVANLNPSPREITEGINTLGGSVVDLSGSTATPEDVLAGKTFYSGDTTLKTGTLEMSDDTYKLFLFQEENTASQEKVYFQMQAGQSMVRPYAFRKNYNNVEFVFNNDIQEIGEQAFYDCPNFEFVNFSSLGNLAILNTNAFYACSYFADKMNQLPSCLTFLGSRCFADIAKENTEIVIPDSVSSIGTYAFASISSFQKVKSITYPANFSESLANNCLQYLGFDCDLRLPERSTIVQNAFNYRGSFNNLTIPAGYTNLKDTCFGAASTDPVSNFTLRTVTFEGSTPPTIGRNIFATQHKTNGFKIYVPDEAIDAYKAISNLSSFVSYIFPVSQKD